MNQDPPAAIPAARSVWDDTVIAYERWAEPLTSAFCVAALARAGVELAGRDILDVASGTGALALAAAALGARVSAVDLSEGMVARLEERMRGLPGCHVRRMDGQALAFEDASFDATFSMFGVMLFADVHVGLTEMRRVTRRGGRVVVGSWSNPDGAGPLPLFMQVFRQVFADVPLRPAPPGMRQLSTPAGLFEAFERAGLTDIATHAEQSVWGGADIDDAMTKLAAFLELVPLYRDLGDADRAHMHQPLRDALLSHATAAGRVDYPVRALITVGTPAPAG